MAFSAAYFEITRTPPDERRRQDLVASEDGKAPVVLLPGAFGLVPHLSFENVPLGKTVSRHLIIRNPSQKMFRVHFEKIPKVEKGFDFSHEDFDLDAKSQALLEISWTPQNGSPLREIVILKLGSHKSQVNLVATCKCPPPPKNQKKKAPLGRPSATNVDPKSVIKFKPQKFFGPPILSAIPDELVDVNPKRQTYAIKGSHPHIQLPIISTPIRDPEDKLASKENILVNTTPIRPQRNLQPLKTTNRAIFHSESNSEFIIPVETKKFSMERSLLERKFEVGSVEHHSKAKKANSVKDVVSEDIPQVSPDTFSRPFDVSFGQHETPNPTKICSKTFVNESDETETVQVVFTESVQEVTTVETFTRIFETFVGREDLDLDASTKYSNTSDLQQNVSPNLRISLPDLELTLSPEPKIVPESAKITKEINLREESIGSNSGRISSGTYIKSPHPHDDHRDLVFPLSYLQVDNFVDDFVNASKPLETIEDTCDDISLLIANQMRLSNGQEPMAPPQISWEHLSDEEPEKEILSAKSSSHGFQLDVTPTEVRPTIGKLQFQTEVDHLGVHGENYLHYTVTENSFRSPILNDLCYCSTGVKVITRDESLSEKSSEIKRELFGSVDQNQESEFPDIDPSACRLSSSTFVKSLEKSRLDTIEEETEGRSKQNTNTNKTFDKDASNLEPTSEMEIQLPPTSPALVKQKTPEIPLRQDAAKRNVFIEISPPTLHSFKPSKSTKVSPFAEKATRGGTQFGRTRNISPKLSNNFKVGLPDVKKDKLEISRAALPRRPSATTSVTRPSSAEKPPVNPPKILETISADTEGGKTFFVEFEEPQEVQINKICEPRQRTSFGKSNPVTRRSFVPEKKLAPALPNRKSMVSRPLIKQVSSRLTLLKPSTNSTGIVRHPNPFASKNMYYDERWIEKQENGFKKWLNFVLTPPDGFDCNENTSLLLAPGKLDVAKLWSACTKDVKVPRAPTREVLSMREYSARRQLRHLRRDAFTLWQSPSIAPVIIKLETEIEKQRIAIRADKQMNKDLGVKKKLLILLLSYNPLWLHIGLETVFGEILPVENLSDIVGISQFIVTRLLSNPDILEQYAHPTVPYHYLPGYELALHQFTLRRFLQLVYFLDQAKTYQIIHHNPCLFNKDSAIKSSKEMLTSFSRDFLSGEGDIIKHLAYLGYKVAHQQTPLDEFDYAVTNIAVDLRCGVRLCRLMEILTSDKSLSTKLRLPAVSRLQKIHNVDVALLSLKKSKAGPPENTTSKDIVDGHMEKTLGLLWHVIFGFQLDSILDPEKLSKEVQFLEKSLEYRVRVGDTEAKSGHLFIMDCKRRAIKENSFNDPKDWTLNSKMQLLLQWARLVCAHYSIEIDNFTVSFSDGRALCYMIHHYYPSFMKRAEIMDATSQQQQKTTENLNESLNDSFGITYNYGSGGAFDNKAYEKCLENEKQNFKTLSLKLNELGGVPLIIRSSEMSNTIPDKKVTATFVAYLSSRLIDLSKEMSAARTIQLAWKHYVASKREKALKVAIMAACVIQRRVRRFLRRQQIMKYTRATIVIQAGFRGYLARKRIADERKAIEMKTLSDAAIIVQRRWRRVMAMRVCEKRRRSIILLQSVFRMRIVRKAYLKVLQDRKRSMASVCLQKYWRGRIARQEVKRLRVEREMLREKAAVIIQKNWKMILQFRKYKRIRSAASLIKSYLKTVVARKRFNEIKKSVIWIQSRFRGYKERKLVTQKLKNVLVVQSLVRRFLANKRVEEIRADVKHKKRTQASVLIQKHFRRHLAIKDYRRQRHLVIFIQSCVRRNMAQKHLQGLKMEKQRTEAAVCLQKHLRSTLARRQLEKLKLERRMLRNSAATVIQKNWKSFTARKSYLQKRNAAIIIQSFFRKHVALKRFLHLRRSVVALQSHFRGKLCRRRTESLKRRIVIVQSLVRRYLAVKLTKKYREEKRLKIMDEAATIIQKHWKRYLAQKCFQSSRGKVTQVQSYVRGFLARRRFSRLMYQYKLTLATICMQKYWRSRIARDLLRKLKQEHEEARRMAAVVIQRNWKMFSTRRQYQADRVAVIQAQSVARRFIARRKFLLQKQSVILLQAKVRGFIARRKLKETKRKIILTQAAARRYLARRQLIHLRSIAHEKKLNKSAVTIQKNWRKFQAIQKYRSEVRKVVVAQSCIRRFICRRTFQRNLCLQRESLAATRIQTCWRSFVARRTLEKLRSDFLQRRKTAATLIQSKWRMILQRNKYRHIIAEITSLQAHVRGWRIRRQFLERKRAAVVIQTAFRGWIAKRTFKQDVRKIIIVQALVRRYFSRIKLVELRTEHHLKRRIESAVILQKNWKMLKARKSYLDIIRKTVILQSFFRMAISRNQYRRLLRHRDMTAAAICFQKLWRARVARNHLEKLKFEQQVRRNNAAVVFQKNWKMIHQVRSYRKTRELIIRCQSRARASFARRRYRKSLQAAVVLQAWTRGQIQRKKYKQDLENVKKVQSCVRIFLAKRRVAKIRQTILSRSQNLAAEIIQKYWRRYKHVKQFRHDLQNVVLVQSAVRGFLARRLFCRNLQDHRESRASTCLQKHWRAKQARNLLRKLRFERHLQVQNSAATTIQRRWRGIQARNKFLQWKQAAISLQAFTRGWIARRKFVSVKKAVCQIQVYYRAKIARQRFELKQRRIVLVQSVIRRFLAKRQLKILKDKKVRSDVEVLSAVRIQRAWRRHRMRQDLTNFHTKRVRIETAARMVQKTLLMWRSRKDFLAKKKAANVIKAFWRGYCCRKRIHAEQKQRLDEVRQKVDQAAKNATEDQKLCNRTVFAIEDLYTYKDMATLIAAVQSLEMSTHYSTWCCSQLTANGCRGVKILAEILQRGNRSVPYQEVISRGFKVFLNIAEFEETRNQMSSVPLLYETVVSCMHKNESNVLIFCIGSALLWKLAQTKEAIAILTQPPLVKKLMDFETKAVSKSQRQQTSVMGRQRATSDLTRVKSISLKRNEHLDNARVVRYHDNPATAIKSLNHRIKSQKTKLKL